MTMKSVRIFCRGCCNPSIHLHNQHTDHEGTTWWFYCYACEQTTMVMILIDRTDDEVALLFQVDEHETTFAILPSDEKADGD